MVKGSDAAFKGKQNVLRLRGASRERVNRLLPERTENKSEKERKERKREKKEITTSVHPHGRLYTPPPVTVFIEPSVNDPSNKSLSFAKEEDRCSIIHP